MREPSGMPTRGAPCAKSASRAAGTSRRRGRAGADRRRTGSRRSRPSPRAALRGGRAHRAALPSGSRRSARAIVVRNGSRASRVSSSTPSPTTMSSTSTPSWASALRSAVRQQSRHAGTSGRESSRRSRHLRGAEARRSLRRSLLPQPRSTSAAAHLRGARRMRAARPAAAARLSSRLAPPRSSPFAPTRKIETCSSQPPPSTATPSIAVELDAPPALGRAARDLERRATTRRLRGRPRDARRHRRPSALPPPPDGAPRP